MHELLVDLWPWVVAFYAIDGLAQLQAGHLLLASDGGPFALLRAGLHLRGLSPVAEAIALHDLPFLEADGLLLALDPKRRGEVAVVEEIDLDGWPIGSLAPLAREGRKVTAGGRLLLAAPTPEHAEVARARLAALAEGAPRAEPRPAEAELAAVRAHRAAQRPWARSLRAVAALLALAVGAAWPLVAWGPALLGGLAGALLAAIGALLAACGLLTFAMWRACGEPTRRSAAAALQLLSFPVAALHPLWHASRPLYARFDPLAVAAALLPPERFAILAGRELRRAALSRAATRASLSGEWDSRASRIEELLTAAGIPRDAALAPPGRHADSTSWCPLCRLQWREGTRCDDCGVALERFPAGG